jgi:hypothetical protein
MRFRLLALFPVAYALAFLALAAWGGYDQNANFLVGARIVTRVLAIAGCLWAASSFQSGDRLRLGWGLLAATTAFILARDVLRLTDRFSISGPDARHWILPTLVVVSNIALVGGLFVLARAWKTASAMATQSPAKVWAVTLVTAALAIAAAGPAVAQSARTLSADNLFALSGVFAAGADIIGLCLIAPLLLTALQMRGGSLSWPWGLITASMVSWLLFDAAGRFTNGWAPGSEVFRGMAGNFQFAAGAAQALVLKHLSRR